jgi:hypothetical protein
VSTDIQTSTDPRFPAVESGIKTLGETQYFVLKDPRAKFFFKSITADGALWSDLDQGFVFEKKTMGDEFDKWAQRCEGRPLLEVENAKNSARYAHEELMNLGCSYVKRPKFANNPKSPTDYHYYAPNDETLLAANTAVYQKSRATPEQLEKIRQNLAAGNLTFDHIKMMPKDLEAQMVDGKLSQTDAKGILYNVTPADERTIVSLKTLAGTGQLTDYVLRHLVEDGAKLTDDQAKMGVEGLLKALETPETLTFTLRNCYDIDSAAKKMADVEMQRKVKAYESLGVINAAGEIDYTTLTTTQARSLIRSGEAYASGRAFDDKVEELNRDGWTAAGSHGRYSDGAGGQQKNYAEGTYQGGKAKSADTVRDLLKSMNAEAQAWPERGLLAGEIVYADSYNMVISSGDGTRVADLEQFARFEKGFTPGEHVNEQIGFVMNRKGAFGIGFPNATSNGEALVLLDAQQFKRDEGKEIKAIAVPSSPAKGSIIAMRGDFAALDLESGETIGVPKTSLSNPQPKYGESVTFTPEGMGSQAAEAAPAARKNGRAGR